MNRFKYGVCEWSMKARGRRLCKAAAESGLNCIQLGVGEEIFRGKGLADDSLAEEYQLACHELNLEIHSLSPQFVDVHSFTRPVNAEDEEIAVKLTEKAIKWSDEFGCRTFLLPVLGRNGIYDGKSFHRAVEYIKRFSEKAAEKGIVTCLEINQSVEQIHNLLDAVGNPMVRIFFDSQNMFAFDGTNMARHFTELAQLVDGIHLKDGIGTELSGSLIGEGTSGFYETARAIKESAYRGSLIIESVYEKPSAGSGETEEALLLRDVKTIKRVFG